MRPISEIKANYRLRIVSSGEDGFAAYINHPCYKPTAIAVIASWGGGWEHVSVSLATFGRKSARSTRPRRKNTSDERRPRP